MELRKKVSLDSARLFYLPAYFNLPFTGTGTGTSKSTSTSKEGRMLGEIREKRKIGGRKYKGKKGIFRI
jgi:hypothetical protein